MINLFKKSGNFTKENLYLKSAMQEIANKKPVTYRVIGRFKVQLFSKKISNRVIGGDNEASKKVIVDIELALDPGTNKMFLQIQGKRPIEDHMLLELDMTWVIKKFFKCNNAVTMFKTYENEDMINHFLLKFQDSTMSDLFMKELQSYYAHMRGVLAHFLEPFVEKKAISDVQKDDLLNIDLIEDEDEAVRKQFLRRLPRFPYSDGQSSEDPYEERVRRDRVAAICEWIFPRVSQFRPFGINFGSDEEFYTRFIQEIANNRFSSWRQIRPSADTPSDRVTGESCTLRAAPTSQRERYRVKLKPNLARQFNFDYNNDDHRT